MTACAVRRALLCGALLLPWLVRAATPVPVHVAKIINFSCAACRAAEAFDAQVRQAVQATGGLFTYATVPDSADSYWRELVYYGARDGLPELEPRVRASLYKGAQDRGLRFLTLAEVLVWLQQDLGLDEATVERLGAAAQQPTARQALGRAFALVRASGATRTPSYVLLKDDAIARLLDGSGGRGTPLAELARQVIDAVQTLSR